MSWEHISGSPDDWPREVYAGLFVVGGKTNELKEATFANVLVTDESLEIGAHTNESFVPQILLKGGTLLTGSIISFDRSSLTLSNLGRARVISAVKVARVLFHRPGARGSIASDRRLHRADHGRLGTVRAIYYAGAKCGRLCGPNPRPVAHCRQSARRDHAGCLDGKDEFNREIDWAPKLISDLVRTQDPK
jgi:hypothetical protein